MHTHPLKFHPEMEVYLEDKYNADARFICKYKDKRGALGYMKESYWEAYDFVNDTARFSEADTEDLMREIERMLGL